MSDDRPCSFCGKSHDRGPLGVGVEGGPFAGIPILTCSAIPPDHFYTDDVFPVGPRGQLHRLTLDE